MKAIFRVSIGCIALAFALHEQLHAANHSLISAVVSTAAAIGQTNGRDDATRRADADRWLRQARQALKAGRLEIADLCVGRAEALNVRYDATAYRFADTPTKVRRDIAATRGNANAGPQPPSQRFTPGTLGANGARAATDGPATTRPGQSRDQVLDTLTNDAAAKARDYVARGRAALQQGNSGEAVVWYQRARGTGATFAQGEYSPRHLAIQLQRASIDTSQLTPLRPAAPFSTKLSDFATEMRRLPQVSTAPSRADRAFEQNVITDPTQLGSARALASPRKLAALRLVAQAQIALQRGDLASAKQFAEQAQAIRVPDSEFQRGETRPWEVLLQVQSAMSRRGEGSRVMPAGNFEIMPAGGIGNAVQPGPSAVQPGVYIPDSDPTRNRYAQVEFPTPGAAPPLPESAGAQLFREGMRALAAQDRDAALRAFREAWQYQQELDPRTRQELKDKLSLLSAASNVRDPREPSALEEVTAQQDLLRQQIFKEVTGETKAAEDMIRTDPRGALERVQQLRDRVGQADLPPASRRQLLSIVEKELTDIEAYVRQNESDIDLKQQSNDVIAGIDRERERKTEIQQQIGLLVDEFNTLMDEERFAEAEVVAKQIRELDPDSPVTKLVTRKGRLAKNLARDAWIRDEKEKNFTISMGNVDAASSANVNDENPLVFGPDLKRWEQLKKTRLERLEMQQRRLSPVELEIQNALKTPVDVRFRDQPLKDVLDTLGQLAGINVFLDPEGLASEGVTSNLPVTLELSQPIQLKSALNLILQHLHLSYVIQNEVLRVTSEQMRDSNVYHKVYNVADLVIPIPNFIPGYNVGLPSAIREAHNALGYGNSVQPVSMAPLTVAANNQSGGATSNSSILAQSGVYGMLKGSQSRPSQSLGYGTDSMGGAALADFDTLIELITSTIQPDTWDEVGGPGAIEPFPTNLSLVISQTQDVHEQIADLLEQLRRLQDLQVTIEVRFITLQDDFFERIGVDFDFDIDDNVQQLPSDDSGPSVSIGLDPDGTPTADMDFSFVQDSFGATAPAFGGFNAGNAANFGFAILSDIEAFFLIQAATGSDRSNVLQAPKVTLFNGQAASVSDVSQRPFVTSLIPVVGDFAAAHQPVIVVLSEGTSLGVQAVVSSNRRFVRLTLVPFFSQIGDVDTFTFAGETTTNTGSNTVDPNGEPTGGVNNAQTTTQGTTVQLPTFSFTTVSTTVSVPDGGTVLLGGIKRLREARNEQGVPMLNKLPYVNRLFKNVGIGRDTQSLMLMVTPRIIIQEEEEEKLGIEVTP
ncbi:MAG: general secretion pathway protein GspD [Planctomycetaceae bacterium]|nr:general secretion pathway protein GspD [Planctomycetaceae bacterium]